MQEYYLEITEDRNGAINIMVIPDFLTAIRNYSEVSRSNGYRRISLYSFRIDQISLDIVSKLMHTFAWAN